MADYETLFQLILAALTFVIIGMFFIVYLMIVGEREKKKLKAMVHLLTTEKDAEKVCQHSFGYLSGYPLNQPIPEECFGCTKAIACMNQRATEKTTDMAELPQQQ